MERDFLRIVGQILGKHFQTSNHLSQLELVREGMVSQLKKQGPWFYLQLMNFWNMKHQKLQRTY